MTNTIVYIQTGCPACEEYLPRIRAAASRHKTRLEIINVSWPAGARKANKHSVRATPTSDFFTEKGTVVRRVGSLPDGTLEKILG